jgi:hypothetical protein
MLSGGVRSMSSPPGGHPARGHRHHHPERIDQRIGISRASDIIGLPNTIDCSLLVGG